MPLYEEKTICPLAVRFTQEHIRPVFQNGMELESTIAEILAGPGRGDYDVILETPFEAIEIIRWHKRDASGEEHEGKHWLTFDNRRLYCLQRAAAALWPQKVGVVVQALYAATDGYKRKDNSSTAGRLVGIGHSMKLLTGHWDWRSAVPNWKEAGGTEAAKLVARDEALGSLVDLVDMPAPMDALERFFQSQALAERAALQVQSSVGGMSTTDPSSPRSAGGCEESTELAAAVTDGLVGRWQDRRQGESYEVHRPGSGEGGLPVRRIDGKSRAADQVAMWYDEKSDLVWWGSEVYAQGTDVRGQSGQVPWYRNNGSWTPKMTWQWLGAARPAQRLEEPEGAAGADASTKKQPHHRRQPRHAAAH